MTADHPGVIPLDEPLIPDQLHGYLSPVAIRKVLILALEPQMARLTVGNAHTNAVSVTDFMLGSLAGIGVDLHATIRIEADDA